MGRKMKKVAIVTIESLNYGNRLQNYALQEILKSLSCSVKTLHRVHESKTVTSCAKRMAQNILQTKAAKFRRFDANIDFSDVILGKDDYPNGLAEKFDYFVVGSDQVWNPYYAFAGGECDFLTFAKNDQKISYAASFGVSIIPEKKEIEYAEYLKSFKSISVREHQGAIIVKKLSGRDATVVLDPTLLLDEEDWMKVEKKSLCRPKGKYIFVYALGDKTDRFENKIKQLKEKYEIFDVRSVQKNGKELPIGPSEFLYLIRNSEEVLTDSFHATVFSIIFHKRYITFNRPGLNMNSRIESLAKVVGAKSQLTGCGDLDCEKGMYYIKVDELLKEERHNSIEFLKNTLSN